MVSHARPRAFQLRPLIIFDDVWCFWDVPPVKQRGDTTEREDKRKDGRSFTVTTMAKSERAISVFFKRGGGERKQRSERQDGPSEAEKECEAQLFAFSSGLAHARRLFLSAACLPESSLTPETTTETPNRSCF